MRIAVIGNCGSGKSTFAQKISSKFGIPYLQLDRLWFEGGGHLIKKDDMNAETVKSYIKDKVDEFTKQDSWVSDGWQNRVQPLIKERADKLIFLDIPLWRRLFNHLKRVVFEERHQELSKWNDFMFTIEIIRRTFTHGPQMREFVAQNIEKAIILKSHKEANTYLSNLLDSK